MSEENVRGRETGAELEAVKDSFRTTAKRLFSIMNEAKGEIAANNTDAEVLNFAQALRRGEELEPKIAAIYDSVNGAEEGAPEGALDAVDTLMTISKRYREVIGN